MFDIYFAPTPPSSIDNPASVSLALHVYQVHVRRGDKWKEAAPTVDSSYDLAARYMQRKLPSRGQALHKQLFISTEDMSVLDYFRNWTSWDVQWANTSNFKPDTSVSSMTYARQLGPDIDMVSSLLNLQLALECGAWVGTLSSNWCRLIDELRSTVACKADMPFLDPDPKQIERGAEGYLYGDK